MNTFFMFAKCFLEGLKHMTPERTDTIISIIYALLGEKDGVLIIDFSGIEQAMKASVALTRATGISFSV